MPVTVEQSTAARTGGWREQLRAFHLTGQGLEECREIPATLATPDARAAVLAETCGRLLCEARAAARGAFDARVSREKARLDDLLRMDDSHSAELVTSESVASSLGTEGNQFLDPSALARALRRPKRPKGMAAERRAKIEWARKTLGDYLDAARDGAPFHVVAAVGDDAFAAAIEFDEMLLGNMSSVQRALRIAHLECDSHEDATAHEEQLNRVTWRSAKADDLLALPPVIALENASQASGAHMASLARLMRSGRPVIALAIAEEDFASFDFGYQCLGFREACVVQSSLDQWEHAAAALPVIAVQARPAVVFLNTAGVPMGRHLFASRTFPHFFYNPGAGTTWKERFSLLLPDGEEAATGALAALHSEAWREHFRLIPQGSWEEEQLEFGEYLARYGSEAPLAVPFLALTGEDGSAMRVALTRDLADACRDRMLAWRLLEELAGVRNSYVESATAQLREELGTSSTTDEAALVERVKIETIQKLVSVLMSSQPLPAGSLSGILLPPMPVPALAPAAAPVAPKAPEEQAAAAVVTPEAEEEVSEDPYIDSFLCTSCNDCMKINKLVFQYDGNKQAYIADAKAGTYAELVKAAEGCPAKCIHPGKPRPGDTSATPEILARAAKLG